MASLVSIPWHPSVKDLRVFAGLQLIFASSIAGMLAWKHGLIVPAAALTATSVLLALVGFIAPAMIRPVYLAWVIAFFPLGWVVTHLVLAFAFFVVLTPIGLLLRLFGQTPLEFDLNPQAESYWKERPQQSDSARYYRQF